PYTTHFRSDRSEDLLPRDAHAAVDVGEHCRLDEVAGAEALRAATSRQEARAFVAPGLDVAQHPLHLCLRNERPHLRHRVDARTDACLLHCLEQFVERLVVDLLLNEKARAGRAHLTL